MNTQLCFLSLLAFSVSVSGCGQPESNQSQHESIEVISAQSSQQKVTAPLKSEIPVYQVLVDVNHPPYSYRNDSGEIVGFEIDLLREIAKQESFQLQLVTSDSGALFDDLKKEENHVIASAIEISPELKKEKSSVAVFSNSYVSTQPVFVYKSTKNKNFLEIKQGSIGIKKGASFLPKLKTEVNRESIKQFDSSFLAFEAMMLDTVDTSINDIQVAFHYINEYQSETSPDSIKIAPIMNKTTHDIVFAVSKDKPEVLKALNSGIEKTKNNGSYEEISMKWLQ